MLSLYALPWPHVTYVVKVSGTGDQLATAIIRPVYGELECAGYSRWQAGSFSHLIAI